MLFWVLAKGISAAAYMDDWATPHPTRTGALAQIDALETIIARPGFRFNAAKRQCSQCVVHLGLLIDTVDMSLGFDRSNSAVARDTLIVYLRTLTEGQNVSHALARRMAGNLGWHAQALQAGRTHIRAWWLYVSFGHDLWHPVRTVLISDTFWWIGVFNTWAISERPLSVSLSCPEPCSRLIRFGFKHSCLTRRVMTVWGITSGRSGPTPRSTEPHRGTLATVLVRPTPASSQPWTTSSTAPIYPTASCCGQRIVRAAFTAPTVAWKVSLSCSPP